MVLEVYVLMSSVFTVKSLLSGSGILAVDSVALRAQGYLTKAQVLALAEKRKHDISLKQIENVKNRLFPTGVLQERVINIAPMYVNYGEDFLSSLIENFEPLGGDFTVLLP